MPRKPYRKEPRYVQRITVRARSLRAVLDMLRYDSCYPETQDDSRKLERLGDGTARGEDCVVNLIRVGRNDNGPTVRRWQSFGCEVLDIQHPDESPR